MDNKKYNVQITETIDKEINEELDIFKDGVNSKSDLGNRIFNYYKDKDLELLKSKEKNTKKLQFALSNENNKVEQAVARNNYKKGITKDSDLIRAMLDDYFKHQKGDREKILFNQNYMAVDRAIKNNNKVWIEKDKEVRVVSPIALIMSENKAGCYMFAWCEKSNEPRNFKVSRFEFSIEINEQVEEEKLEQLRPYLRDWDPSLSMNKEVKIRFHKEALEKLEKAIIGKPKLKRIEGNIHVFKCTVFHGKNYFDKFIGNFDVIEPLELKEYFEEEEKRILEKLTKKYQK